MKILIACHCKSPVSYLENGRRLRASPKLTFTSDTIDEADVEISYIDYHEHCPDYGKPLQYSLWKDIPNKYFDYIWFHFCPIWGQMGITGKANEVAIGLFNRALKKVKTGGKIIIFTGLEVPDTYFESLLDAVKHKLTYESKEKKDLPFFMESTTKSHHNFKYYYILTKAGSDGGAGGSTGGYRRRQSSKRRVTRKRITRKRA